MELWVALFIAEELEHISFNVLSNSNDAVLIYRLESYIAEYSGWKGSLRLPQSSPPPTKSRILQYGTQLSIILGSEYLWIRRAHHICAVHVEVTWCGKY